MSTTPAIEPTLDELVNLADESETRFIIVWCCWR